MVKVLSCSVVSNTLQSYGLQPTGLLCPGISWERILEWVGIPFSRGSSWPRDWTHVSHIAGGVFTTRVTREALIRHRVKLIILSDIWGLTRKIVKNHEGGRCLDWQYRGCRRAQESLSWAWTGIFSQAPSRKVTEMSRINVTPFFKSILSQLDHFALTTDNWVTSNWHITSEALNEWDKI